MGTAFSGRIAPVGKLLMFVWLHCQTSSSGSGMNYGVLPCTIYTQIKKRTPFQHIYPHTHFSMRTIPPPPPPQHRLFQCFQHRFPQRLQPTSLPSRAASARSRTIPAAEIRRAAIKAALGLDLVAGYRDAAAAATRLAAWGEEAGRAARSGRDSTVRRRFTRAQLATPESPRSAGSPSRERASTSACL